MAKVDKNIPEKLRPYVALGLDIDPDDVKGDNVYTMCPFCMGEKKLGIVVENGMARCNRCDAGESGKSKPGFNIYSFIRAVWQASMERTSDAEYEELRNHRALLHISTLKKWGVCKSIITDEWMVPGYNAGQTMTQLYRYVSYKGEMGLMALDGLPHAIHGASADLFDPLRPEVYLCEGPWDAMALWEVMRCCRDVNAAGVNVDADESQSDVSEGNGYTPYHNRIAALFANNGEALENESTTDTDTEDNPDSEQKEEKEDVQALCVEYTGNPSLALINSVNILAVPGAQTFKPRWCPLFANKKVTLLYDSDHLKKSCVDCKKSYSCILHGRCPQCGKMLTAPFVQPAGYEGMKKVSLALSKADDLPTLVRYIHWGDDGYTPLQPSGFDIRDWLKSSNTDKGRVETLQEILDNILPIPAEWIPGRDPEAEAGKVTLECLSCTSYDVLVNQWRKALKWTPGHDRAFAFALAVCLSTLQPGDPLWGCILGPPGSGKSTLSEALSVARQYVYPCSEIKSFYSGYKTDAKGEEDHSTLSKMLNKTVTFKDAGSLLKQNNRDQILGEMREIYDGVTRVSYRNAIHRSYPNIRVTMLLWATSAMLEMDSSELGERYVRCFIMREIDEDMEDEILARVALKADKVLGTRTRKDRADSMIPPQEALARRMTGGYVNFLRVNDDRLINSTSHTEQSREECVNLGKFVAYMRVRQSKRQDEIAERELATRLVSQFIRLARCMAAVMNRDSVDDEIMSRMYHITLDSAEGKTLSIARILRRHHAGHPDVRMRGMSGTAIAAQMQTTERDIRGYLQFLRKRGIGVLESYMPDPSITRGIKGAKRELQWRLTNKVRTLYLGLRKRAKALGLEVF